MASKGNSKMSCFLVFVGLLYLLLSLCGENEAKEVPFALHYI